MWLLAGIETLALDGVRAVAVAASHRRVITRLWTHRMKLATQVGSERTEIVKDVVAVASLQRVVMRLLHAVMSLLLAIVSFLPKVVSFTLEVTRLTLGVELHARSRKLHSQGEPQDHGLRP